MTHVHGSAVDMQEMMLSGLQLGTSIIDRHGFWLVNLYEPLSSNIVLMLSSTAHILRSIDHARSDVSTLSHLLDTFHRIPGATSWCELSSISHTPLPGTWFDIKTLCDRGELDKQATTQSPFEDHLDSLLLALDDLSQDLVEMAEWAQDYQTTLRGDGEVSCYRYHAILLLRVALKHAASFEKQLRRRLSCA